MARPKKEVVRTEVIRVRFTTAERRILKSLADRTGTNIAEFIRDRTMNYRILPRLTDLERDYLLKLIGMATNINTIAHKAHLGEATHSMVSNLLIEVNQQIEKLQ
jgi:hypothetical protein